MHIENFLKLHSKLTDKDQILRTQVLIHFFAYANAGYETFKKYMEFWVSENEKVEHHMTAAVLSMYANGKVCLQISQKINDEIENDKLGILRNKEKAWAVRFNGFRDDANHPVNDQNFFVVSRIGNTPPNFTIRMLDKNSLEEKKKYDINPEEDLKKLHSYLEQLASIYEEEWAIY